MSFISLQKPKLKITFKWRRRTKTSTTRRRRKVTLFQRKYMAQFQRKFLCKNCLMSTHFFAAFPCPIQAQPILMKMFMLQSIIRWHLYDHAGKLLYIFLCVTLYSSDSSMPMPEGLIPVGNAVGKLKPFMPKAPVPIPASTFLGGSAGASAMAALRNQYDPLPVTDFFDSTEMINNTIPIYIAGTQGHVFVCLHGAGHSAMSFAVAAEKLKQTSTIVAFDWRGHGNHTREDEADMSQETLISDSLEVLNYVHQKFSNRTIIVIGHSMGGAIATKTVRKIERELAGSDLALAIGGVVIIDVVEGTAMEALPFMEQIVKNRPVHFADLQSVIRYGVVGGQVRDKRSARISMPA